MPSEGLPQGSKQEDSLQQTADPRAHYVELDALRGIAILGVVVSHITGVWLVTLKTPLEIPLLGVNASNLFFYGSYGVSLFFLLSGYLLTWTEESRARKGAYGMRSYALRRALRLVPAYYVTLLLVIVTRPASPPATEVLLHLSFLHGFNPNPSRAMDPILWSLTPEVVFYCILPVVILMLPRLPHRLVLFGIFLAVSLVTRVYMSHIVVDLEPLQPVYYSRYVRYLYYLPTTHLYLFLAGVLLRKLVERLGTRSVPRWQTLLASALFLGSVSFLTAFPYLGATRDVTLRSPSGMLVDLAVISFFASALLGAPLLRGLLRWRPLAFVGTVSYSLFLLHGSVLFLSSRYVGYPEGLKGLTVGRGDLGAWASFSVYALGILAVAVAVSYLSYRYVESPFLRYKPK